MELIIKEINKLPIIFVLILLFTGCREQDDMFEQYVPIGGITYPGKADDIQVKSGIGRVQIIWPKANDRIVRAGVWWNNNLDSVLFDVAPEVDTIRQHIELPEGVHSFIVRTFDKKGNISVPVEVIGRSIGEKYMSSFYNRGIVSYSTKGTGSLVIQWDEADESKGAKYNEIVYTSVDDVERVITTLSSVKITEIDDYKTGTSFQYKTVYQPDPEDDFEVNTAYTEVTHANVLVDKSKGKVIAYSSQHGAGAEVRASNAYDGIITKNRWHSAAGAYPHFITIDLGAEVSVSRLVISPSTYDGKPDRRMPGLIRWEISKDNVTWENIGEYDYDNSENNWDPRVYVVTPVEARYVRLTGLTDPSGQKIMCLAEIDVYSAIGEGQEPLTPNNPWEKHTWSIASYSSDWSPHFIHHVIDGHKANFWHSEPFDATKNGMPQWFVIDMKKIRPAINGFKIWNRQDDHGLEPKNIRFSVSNDNLNWTTILEVAEMSKTWQTELDYQTVGKVGGRYLKVEVLSNWLNGGGWTYIAEITPY